MADAMADSDVEASGRGLSDAAPAHRLSTSRWDDPDADQREVAIRQRSSNSSTTQRMPARTVVPDWSPAPLGLPRSVEATPVPQAWCIPAPTRREQNPTARQTFTREVDVAVSLANESLGFCLALDDNGHAYVSELKPGSVLDRDGRIRVGDRIIGIGGRRGDRFSDQRLITMMKEALRSGMLQMAVARDVAADSTGDTMSLDVFDDIDVDDFGTGGAGVGSAGQRTTQRAPLDALLMSDDSDGMDPADSDTARDRNSMPGVPERDQSSVLKIVNHTMV